MPSALRARPGGDDVVVASRGSGTVRVLRLDDSDAQTLVEAPAGSAARDLVVTADGILVADQAGDTLLALDVDGAETARLPMPSPASILPLT